MSKLIFISNNLYDKEKVKAFAKKSAYTLEYYSKEEWKAKNKKSRKATNQKSYSKNTKNSHLSILPFPKNPNQNTMKEIKVEAMKNALLKAKGNASKAANILQIGRATFYRKVKGLSLNVSSVRNSLKEEEKQPAYKKTA